MIPQAISRGTTYPGRVDVAKWPASRKRDCPGAPDSKTNIYRDDRFINLTRTDPVFGSLSNKGALSSSSARVTLNWMTPRTYQVIQLGQFDDESIPVVLVKWPFLQVILDEC